MTDREVPYRLLVEGHNDKHVVVHICKRHQCKPPSISDKGSINELLESISVELKASGLRAIGILVDANDSLDSRWQSLRDRLLKNEIPVPSHCDPNGTIIEGKPRIGIWLMPDNSAHGTLEHFVEKMIPAGDPVWPLSQQYIDDIPENQREFKKSYSQKAKIRAWLATRKVPGQFMGTAIKAQDLKVDGDLATKFFTWLQELFEL